MIRMEKPTRNALIIGGVMTAIAAALYFIPPREMYMTVLPPEVMPDSQRNVALLAQSNNDLLPLIKQAVESESAAESPFDLREPFIITEQLDITGDGAPEYIVNLGNGGAAMDAYAIAKIVNGKPVLPKLKDADGTTAWQALLSGSGGSGRYANSFFIDSEKQSVTVKSYSIYGEPGDYCYARVYEWNEASGNFEYSQELSEPHQKELEAKCDEVKLMFSESGATLP